MQSQQQTKLQLLVRRNKGRTEHQYYATELSHLLKAAVGPCDILDLEETDRLSSKQRTELAKSYKEIAYAFKEAWEYKAMASWTESCRRLGQKLRGESAVLFVGPYEFCGAIRTKADAVLNEIFSLLEFDKDSVSLQSAASDSGLLVDLYEEHSERLVELVVWGRWKALAGERKASKEDNS
jgi:hypothetical protein